MLGLAANTNLLSIHRKCLSGHIKEVSCSQRWAFHVYRRVVEVDVGFSLSEVSEQE